MLIKLENIYINITGPDGVGKDSVLSNVLKHLSHYKTFREPGGTDEAEMIRSIILCISDEERKKYFEQALNMNLLNLTREYVLKAYDIFNSFDDIHKADDKIVGIMEAYLYAASRNETNNRLVIPNLEQGLTVIGSRSVSCSMSYQGNARGLGYNLVWDINKPTLTRLPDFEIYLDISTEIAMQRLENRKGKQDRLDNESFDFHRKTREGYLKYYDTYCPYPVIKIDASGTIEENTQKVLDVLSKYSKSTN
ncbi:dTMP kinase [[Brevibacterium] frigoritolerans]|nr:dTMP kinase [Peribacillus frigoritolerans]